jgi:hypothetical protein
MGDAVKRTLSMHPRIARAVAAGVLSPPVTNESTREVRVLPSMAPISPATAGWLRNLTIRGSKTERYLSHCARALNSTCECHVHTQGLHVQPSHGAIAVCRNLAVVSGLAPGVQVNLTQGTSVGAVSV